MAQGYVCIGPPAGRQAGLRFRVVDEDMCVSVCTCTSSLASAERACVPSVAHTYTHTAGMLGLAPHSACVGVLRHTHAQCGASMVCCPAAAAAFHGRKRFVPQRDTAAASTHPNPIHPIHPMHACICLCLWWVWVHDAANTAHDGHTRAPVPVTRQVVPSQMNPQPSLPCGGASVCALTLGRPRAGKSGDVLLMVFTK